MAAINLLALLAILIQSTSVRICAAEQLLLGFSCHSDDAAACITADPVDDNALQIPHNGHGETRSCVCEMPKGSASRPPVSVQSAVAPLSFPTLSCSIDAPPAQFQSVTAAPPRLSVSATRSLPLLT